MHQPVNYFSLFFYYLIFRKNNIPGAIINVDQDNKNEKLNDNNNIIIVEKKKFDENKLIKREISSNTYDKKENKAEKSEMNCLNKKEALSCVLKIRSKSKYSDYVNQKINIKNSEKKAGLYQSLNYNLEQYVKFSGAIKRKTGVDSKTNNTFKVNTNSQMTNI